MPLPVATGVARFTMEYTLPQGQDMVNVFHVLDTTLGTWSDVELAEVKDEFVAFHGTGSNALKTFQVPGCILTKITGRDLSSQGGNVREWGFAVAGTNPSQSMPNRNALVATWRTGQAGRSRRGRTYFGGFGEDNNDGGVFLEAARANLDAQCESLIAGIAAAGNDDKFRLCVLSYYANHALRATPLATVITSVDVNGRWDTQRRRGRG